MRVLVIEDEVRLAENIAAALREGAGFAVDCAADGETGWELTRTPSIAQRLRAEAPATTL